MDITKRNFTETFDEISEAINQATFLAIDAEFTGLSTHAYNHTSPYDTPEERYLKIREGSMDFLLVQFGLSCFRFDEDTQSYEARPYNFYVFPRQHSRDAPDRRFQCQSSSILFLASQGFDFNKLFNDGISYLTPTQEENMRATLNGKHLQRASSPRFSSPGSGEVPPEHKKFIMETCDKISKFMESEDETDELKLDPCSGYQRKLIFQTVGPQFPSAHLESKTDESKERYILVTKVRSEEELKKKQQDTRNTELMELEEAVGFTKVIKLIAQSGKMMVGHNMLLDVMLIINQFLHPLPEKLDEFKAMVKCTFPRLVDTKHMGSTHPFKGIIVNTVLGNLQKALEKDPFSPAPVEFAQGFSRYTDATEKPHEAGYDAYVTGCIFATMTNYLGKDMSSSRPVVQPSPSLVTPFLNRIFLMKMADIPFLNLEGADLQPSRDHVFHLSFPREWKSSDINNLFGPFGNIHISWLNELSAFVALYKKDNADAVWKALGETRTLYRLVPYNIYKETQASSPSTMPHTPAPPIPSTPRTRMKRPAPQDEDDEKESAQPLGKKLRSADHRVATTDVMEEDDIGEPVPRSQTDKKAAKKEAAEADSTEMFAVPDW